MNGTKFSVNALLIVMIIFSAIAFFFTIKMLNLADINATNEFHPVEGTNLGIRYSSREPDGIYEGTKSSCTLKLEGTFGYDWGAVICGDKLYLNEYRTTDLGVMFCDLVRVDINTFEKETVRKNTVLQGKYASGELVCVSDAMVTANFPKTNPLCSLYAATAPRIYPETDGALVMFINPSTSWLVYSVRDENALKNIENGTFSKLYIERTLAEVTK